MIEKIGYKILAKLLKGGFKQIEKINWATKILDICFKSKILSTPKVWDSFCEYVKGVFLDAADEAERAKNWPD